MIETVAHDHRTEKTIQRAPIIRRSTETHTSKSYQEMRRHEEREKARVIERAMLKEKAAATASAVSIAMLVMSPFAGSLMPGVLAVAVPLSLASLFAITYFSWQGSELVYGPTMSYKEYMTALFRTFIKGFPPEPEINKKAS